jgi:hypothetical protein
MSKYVMVVQSQAKPGQDDAYNAWYDGVHYADILSIPGVVSGRRFEATPVGLGAPMLPYLAVFEVETENPASIMAELGKRAETGTMEVCDALDAEATVLRMFRLHEVHG